MPQDIWNEVQAAAGRAIGESSFEPTDRHILLSIVLAGIGTAESFHREVEVFQAYKDLTFEQALKFSEVFSVAMVSRWVRTICDQDNTLDRETMWTRLANDILRMFGTDNTSRLEESRIMDLQYNALADAADQNEAHDATAFAWVEADLLMSLAARALGKPFVGKLAAPPIPCGKSYELWKEAGIESTTTDIEELTMAFHTLVANEAGMYASFKALQGGAEHSAQESQRSWLPWRRAKG